MRAGDDGDVFSLEVLYTPYRLARWVDRLARAAALARPVRHLVEPGFLDGVRRWRVVTPPDYERDFNLARGHAPSFAGGPVGALLAPGPRAHRLRDPGGGPVPHRGGNVPGRRGLGRIGPQRRPGRARR